MADIRNSLGLLMIAGVLGGNLAAAEETPDLEFLEYLGSWDGSDADWLMFTQLDGAQPISTDERNDPAPESEESTETDDEL